jgi:hypothetical protein
MARHPRGRTLAHRVTGGLQVETYIRFMHNGLSRIVRTVIGWALVVKAVYQPIDLAIVMMVLGTVIAVFAIADVCLVEQIAGWARRPRIAAATKPVIRHA